MMNQQFSVVFKCFQGLISSHSCPSGIETLLEKRRCDLPESKLGEKVTLLRKTWRPSHTVSPSANTGPDIVGAANGDNVMNQKTPNFDTVGITKSDVFPCEYD